MAKTGDAADLTSHIKRVLENAEPEFLPDELSRLTDEIEASLEAYASETARAEAAQKETEDLKSHRKTALSKSMEKAIARMRDAVRKEHPLSRAEKHLRNELKTVLTDMKTGLTDEEKRRVEDRMIRLYEDFSHAPKDKRSEVYSRGEQEILSSLRPEKLRSMTAGGGAY